MALHVDYILNITDLPRECIMDCGAGAGSKDAVCHDWREDLGLTVDRERAVECLAGYGAWSREELAQKSDDELAEIVLWIACGNFAEYISECERHAPPVDPFGERPDDFDPSAGSDIFCFG